MADETIPSETVLDETPTRALKFMSAISTSTVIFALLAKRGYNQKIHEKGWQLLFAASGYTAPEAAAPIRPEAAEALAELDSWDDENFRVTAAAWIEFPAQKAFLFDGLEAQAGVKSIVAVKTFCDRLDEIESGKDRKATKKVDQAAMAKLAERGITPDVRKHLRSLIATATATPEAPDTSAGDTKAEARREAKLALWKHFSEWSEIARVLVKRRDHLILLGLAKRKVGKKKDNKGAGDASAKKDPKDKGGEQ